MSTHYYMAYLNRAEALLTLAECLIGNPPNKRFTIVGQAGWNDGTPVFLFGMDTIDPLRVIQNDYGFPEFECHFVCCDDSPELPEFVPIIRFENEPNSVHLERVAELLFPLK